MAAVTVLAVVFFVSVKVFSYGIWEAKRENKAGGGLVMLMSLSALALAIRYTVKYFA